MHIRTRLVVLVLSVLLPAFAAAGLAVWFVYTEQKQAQEKGLAEAARALALLVDNELQTTEGLLRGLAVSPALAKGDLEAFYTHIKQLAITSETTIVLSDLNGRQILNTRLPFGATPPAINARIMELRQQLGADKTIISDLFYAPVGKRYDFAVQVPVFIDGSVRYHLARGISATLMQPLLNNQGFPVNWIGSVVDRQGVIVSRTRDAEQFIGKSASGSLAEKVKQALRSGTNDGYALDGTHVRAFFHRAPYSEWTVVLSVPFKELRQPALHAAILLTTLMIVILASAILLARHYASQTLVPVRRLREAAVRLGRDEQVAPAASGVAELDEVHAALVLASAQLRENKREMDKQVAEAVASTERAQRALLQAQKLEALGRLTGGVAHDFNNVLQTLTTSLQLVRIERNPERIPERIATCERAIDRAAALVGQMRAFGRVHEANLETMHVDQAIDAIKTLLENALPSAVQLRCRFHYPLWPVTVDRVQFELALLNLVINARDALHQHGTIAITVCNDVVPIPATGLASGEYVRIDVADNGAGMTDEVMEKALDPFFTTKPVDKGSGLGLPQAYGFARQSGGTLQLDSRLGAGTTVSIYLPRAAQGEVVPTAVKQANDASRSAVSGIVLFVEDDALVRESVVPALANAGFKVVVAKSGEEAAAMLAAGLQVDAVFSDIVMPGEISGLDLVRQVSARHPSMAVLLATGYSSEQVDLPGVRLLNKPYQVDEVIDILAADLSSKTAL